MDRENVTELLKNYPSYKYAVRQYERHQPRASAGIANYDAMPSGSGAPELFFVANSRMGDMGHTSLNDYMDYQAYKSIVTAIDGALEILSLDEQYVIKKKWLEGVELSKIAENSHYAYITVRRFHKSGIKKLEQCLRFDRAPKIELIAQL